MLVAFGRLFAAMSLCVCLPISAATPAPNGVVDVSEPASTFVAEPNAETESLAAKLKTGKWKAVEAHMGGQAMPPAVVAQMMPGLMQFGDEKVIVTLNGKSAGEVPYSVDESVSPARMTIDGALVANPSAAKRGKSTVIFRIEGDKLQICGGKDPANPPAEFSADAENGNAMITYERAK